MSYKCAVYNETRMFIHSLIILTNMSMEFLRKCGVLFVC